LTAKDFLGGQNYTAKENLIFLAMQRKRQQNAPFFWQPNEATK